MLKSPALLWLETESNTRRATDRVENNMGELKYYEISHVITLL